MSQFKVDHLAPAVHLDVCDCLPPSFESSVLDPKGVLNDWGVFISECLGIAFAEDMYAFQATEEVDGLVALSPTFVPEIPVQVVEKFVVEVVLGKIPLN